MRANEAKDFLVQETTKQAVLEGVPFSDLERRMMYFTEVEEMPEDPIKLNDEFEAKYDSDEYEAKVFKLMHHAHARLKKENPESAHRWNQAVRELSKGDHYILVLWGESIATKRPPHDSLKLLGTGLLVAALVIGLIFVLVIASERYGIQWSRHPKNLPPRTSQPLPVWVQRTLIGLIVWGYFYAVAAPWILRKFPSLGQQAAKLFHIIKPRLGR